MAKINGSNFLAKCISCEAALSNFEPQAKFSTKLSGTLKDELGEFYTVESINNILCKCTGCGIGAIARYTTDIYGGKHLVDFHPEASTRLVLPEKTPKDITSEFRSAENCANINEYRPAGAMLRSTLDKVLLDHGYTERYLSKNIEDAFKDGVLTLPLKKRASDIVKALGDEILHQQWKEITPNQYESAHEYTQRILENFYDEPKTVNEILLEKGRIKEKAK